MEIHMQSAMGRSRNRRRAFTLLEVLMVLVILGLLAGLVVYNLSGIKEGAEKKATEANIAIIEGAVRMFQMQVGRYPTALTELVQKPEDERDAKNWNGPYILEKDLEKLKDGWGHELIYKAPGEYNTNSFDLSSPGKDGEPGNDDDIVNWKKG